MPGELIWGTRHANAGWHESTGVPVDRWHDAVVPEDLARCTTALADARRLGYPIGCEARLRLASGEGRRFRVVFAPAPGDAWFACAHDVETPRRWLAVVSHELRAPLATLLLWEHVLRDPAADAERRAQALEAIHACAMAQSRIVEDLVELARSSSGTLHIETRRVELAPVVEAAVTAAALTGACRRIAVIGEIESGPFPVHADIQRLRQILDNVLANSLKFSCEGGTVKVTVRSADRDVEVAVRDDGDGIAADLLPHVFTPFIGTSEGLGLGLAIAHELAVLHGGTLAARSDGPGYGATFVLTLPIAAGEDAAP